MDGKDPAAGPDERLERIATTADQPLRPGFFGSVVQLRRTIARKRFKLLAEKTVGSSLAITASSLPMIRHRADRFDARRDGLVPGIRSCRSRSELRPPLDGGGDAAAGVARKQAESSRTRKRIRVKLSLRAQRSNPTLRWIATTLRTSP